MEQLHYQRKKLVTIAGEKAPLIEFSGEFALISVVCNSRFVPTFADSKQISCARTKGNAGRKSERDPVLQDLFLPGSVLHSATANQSEKDSDHRYYEEYVDDATNIEYKCS
jgi:hypothetical protein